MKANDDASAIHDTPFLFTRERYKLSNRINDALIDDLNDIYGKMIDGPLEIMHWHVIATCDAFTLLWHSDANLNIFLISLVYFECYIFNNIMNYVKMIIR